MKKNIIIGLLLATSFLIGCNVSNKDNVKANEQQYLKEIGISEGYIGGSTISVYSDDKNNKLIYTIENSNYGTVSIAVTDKNNSKN